MLIFAIAALLTVLLLSRSMKRPMEVLVLLASGAVLLLPAVAQAGVAGAAVNDVIRDYLQTIAMGVVTGAISWIAAKVGKLLGSKAQEATDKVLRGIAQAAVNYAEERAHQWLKAHGGSDRMPGAEKKNLAVGFALDLARRHGMRGATLDRLGDLIDASLGARRRSDPFFALEK